MSERSMHPDERIARVASRQHGLITHRQLRGMGLSDGAIRARRRSGYLRPVHVAVYAVGHDSLTLEGRRLAAVMACGPEALLSHAHAAALWGMLAPWEEPSMAAIDVTVPAACGRGRRPGIVVHRTRIPSAERAVRVGIPVTAAARTVLDLATGASDRLLERVIDQALTDEHLTVPALHACAAEHRGSRGAGGLRRMLAALERYDSLTDSELEEQFLARVRGAGLPDPRMNARVAGMRLDAIWPSERVAVELDGYRWHRTRSRSESDRRRELRLRAAGWRVMRYSARQVFEEPFEVIADLSSVLAAAAVRGGG
ncbi:MAG: DUF559 domain-containing protein [Solirubrobacterales bacterium]|nr:DUF559 domain-containing protein [Solirubrobacterales bacterium]